MFGSEDEAGESEKRADMFEILAHQTRIKILKTLKGQPMSFAELKRALDIESSGNLQHHLAKLGYFIKKMDDGKYTLSDDAKEAIRVLDVMGETTRPLSEASSHFRAPFNITTFSLVALGALLLVTLLFVYSGINALRRTSIPLYENITLGAETLQMGNSSYYYLLLSSSGLSNGTRITFHGVTFTYLPSLQWLVFPPNKWIRIYYVELRGVTEPGLDFTIIPFLGSSPGMTINKTGTYAEVRFSRYFMIDSREGELELIPILPWKLLRGIFTTHEHAGATAFQIGPSTIMLLVSTQQG